MYQGDSFNQVLRPQNSVIRPNRDEPTTHLEVACC